MGKHEKRLRRTRYPGIQYRPSDRAYIVRVRCTDPRTNQRQDIVRVLPGVTEEEAITTRAAIVQRVTAGELAREGAQVGETLTAYALRWVVRKRAEGLRSGTLDHYVRTLETYVLPYLGDLRLDAILSKDIYWWKDQVSSLRKPNGHEYSKWTMAGWHRVLTNILGDAAVEFDLPRDPTKGIPGFRKPRSPRADRYLRPDELRTFLALVEEHWNEHFALTVIIATFGLRWGEATALRLQDVDREAEEIRVAQSQVRGRVTATKTDAVRLLPLTHHVRKILDEHLARLRTKEHPGLKKGLLFPARAGGYRTPSSVTRAWKDVSRRIGNPWEIGPHDLRRTCQNLLRLAGASQVVQQSILGHSSDGMTLHYSHVGMPEKRAAHDNVFSLMGYRSEKAMNPNDDQEEMS